MQLPKPVLLEGSPGVGKTSLVVALAEYSGHSVVRINLSEQTDMMDLLGSDLPTEGVDGMGFAWSDGILLQALKVGCWVLLDELNLAPQSVLEGLNAILDHRAEIFIPELGLTFKCPPSFRVFACQNPSCQGGGRKGLPKSFLNRFTKVYVDELSADDYLFICQSRFPSIPSTLLSKLISFNSRLYEDTMILNKYGQDGSPWEFNLRDVIRSCQLIESAPENTKVDCFLNVIYLERMRTAADRKEVVKLFETVFGVKPLINESPQLLINTQYLVVGRAIVGRNHFQRTKISKSQLKLLPGILQSLEAVVHCVKKQWMCIVVGPYSSGKTSLIRLLAQLTGNALIELNLSSATDVSELLGCFEQYNSFHVFRSVMSQVELYVDEYLESRLKDDLICESRGLFAKWFAFLAASNCNSCMSTSTFARSWNNGSCTSLSPLIEIIEQLKHDLEIYKLPVSWSNSDLDRTLKTVFDLQQNNMAHLSAKFEWVAGDLVKAIECGEWVVLDNANLCNPTVLDRINSLVEQEGSITVNEKGLVDGKPVTLHAHPNFRMFLTVDPKHGEISRAMRNRGLEIFIMQPNCLRELDFENSEMNDLRRFLVLCGIPFTKLVIAMSEAHMYAKTAGLRSGVRITLLELDRWVQLFQQLVMNGNQPRWSLQLSWEHTYLSSLGEVEGRDIIILAKDLYLSDTKWDKIDPRLECFLSLPGGWRTPYSIRSLLLYSREVCVRQNCMYLECLAAQCATQPTRIPLKTCRKDKPSFVSVDMLHSFLFPNTPDQQKQVSINLAEIDLVRANKVLFFAANWTVEQATKSDLDLYIQWFKLLSNCHFLESFSKVLEMEQSHCIWKIIFDCHKINVDALPIPLLSMQLIELVGFVGSSMNCHEHLGNAIRCVPLLRLTFLQWKTEEEDTYAPSKPNPVRLLLKSLRSLEIKVLEVIVESENIFHIYSELLEHHILFWRIIASSCLDQLCLDQLSFILSWLKKEALKLKHQFPDEVKDLLVQDESLCLEYKICMDKQTLWAHGGHPFAPSSADVYYKIQQLVNFCDAIWLGTKTKHDDFTDESSDLDVALSSNPNLRRLVTKAVSLSSYMTTTGDGDDSTVVVQLEQLYQDLKAKYEHERRDLNMVSQLCESSTTPLVTTCCTFSPALLCRKSGIESWLGTLPLFDKSSLSLDLKLLQEVSKCVFVDPTEAYQVLINTYDLLQHVPDYSLDLSSRSPLDFVAHQTLVWILEAWSSVKSVHEKIGNSVLEMWFRWHSSLWHCCYDTHENFEGSSSNGPIHIMHLTRSSILEKILQGNNLIADYDMQSIKLRVASRSLWKDTPLHGTLSDTPLHGTLSGVLRSVADTLLKQILFVHQKYFDEDVFGNIKSALFQNELNCMNQEQLQTLKSLISSSSHNMLSSLVGSVIEPLLKELYSEHQSSDSTQNLGFAWLHIGLLRFHLLVSPGGPDPAMKYAFKHSQIVEKMSSLDLEIQVRRECQHLAGMSSINDDEQKRVSIQKLEKEKKRIHSKVVFRPRPLEYKTIRSECSGFLKNFIPLLHELESNPDLSVIVNIASNWQVTSAAFISRLSEEYAEYIDIIRPVQVAVYEMKLGLSMAVSAAREREYLKKVDIKNNKDILVAVYSLMQFPRELPVGFTPEYIRPPPTLCDREAFKSIKVVVKLLKKLAIISSEDSPDKEASPIQLKVMVKHIILIYMAYRVCCSLLMDEALFQHLKKIFARFASMWMDMKSKVKEDGEAQYYKFRPRSVNIEDIMEGDLPALCMLDSDGCMSYEGEEKLMEQEFTEVKQSCKEDDSEEEDWGLIPDYILTNIVAIHNQLFGSHDLLERPGVCQITNESRLQSFVDSYRLGSKVIKDLPGVSVSMLDDFLIPEHLLRACLENEKSFSPTSQASHSCNVYKNTNASIMFNMVNPLIAVKEKVKCLLEEWSDHPGLQKVLDVTNALLAIPVNSPLSKALLGLQLLVSRARTLLENTSSLYLTDQLQPIDSLVASWQKLELECWPALLDGIQEKYEINAGKLWFPLHAVLHRDLSNSEEVDNALTMQSMEEFIQTSCVGDFKKRLHLLLSFHGQLNHGIFFQAYSSPCIKENLKILYNTFGYYVQFLPLVLEKIGSSRRTIEKDLKDCLKLFNWEHSSIENFRRTRQKIMKHVKKFNDTLQQPLIVILNQDVTIKREKNPSWLEQKESDSPNTKVLQFPLDLAMFSNMRFSWYEEWRKKGASALQSMCLGTSDVCFLKIKDHQFMTAWREGWTSLEKICTSAAEFAYLWKHKAKNLNQRRSLGDLLKILESCGLSRYRSMVLEVELKSGQPSSSFIQPSYDVRHLLQPEFCPKISAVNLPTHSHNPAHDKCDLVWKAANQCYFKNLFMVQQLRDVSLNFKKDLTLEQVNRSASFVEDLIIIQQQQRLAIYGVSEQLQKLKQHANMLDSIGMCEECSVTPNQHAVLKCMWQQKHLFDNLLAVSKDVHLLIQTVKNSHLTSCDEVRTEADEVSVFIDKFIPLFLEAKESLDKQLLNSDGAVVTSVKCLPFIVSKRMEQLVESNFQILTTFGEMTKDSHVQKVSSRSMKESLLNRLKQFIGKGKVINAEFISSLVTNDHSFDAANALFTKNVREMDDLLRNVFGELDLVHEDDSPLRELSADITLWKEIFEKALKKLQPNQICDALCRIVHSASKLINCGATRKVEVYSRVEMYVKHLNVSVYVLLTYGEGILSEFLDAHKTIAEMTHALANLFILLFSNGFGATEDATEDTACDGSQDANGTGMGEGEGMNDVSDQIDDDSQLLGTSEKQDDLVNSDKAQSDKEKGIEMDEDFAADTYSVSEDSGEDDNEDGEDPNLDSMMGEAEEDNKIVDEKLWGKDEDDKPEKSVEKYESGSSVKEMESNDKELRAKEDNALSQDDSRELGNDEPNNLRDENNDSISDDEGKIDDLNLEKNNAFEDPSGVQLNDEQDLKETEDSDMIQESGSDPDVSDEDLKDEADQTIPTDDIGGVEESDQMDGNSEAKEGGEDADTVNMDLEPSRAKFESDKIESSVHPPLDHQSAEPMKDYQKADFSKEPEMQGSSSSNMISGLAPSRGSPLEEVPLELAMPDSGDGSKLASELPKPRTSDDVTRSTPRTPTNPYRSIGDAMEEWKERVKVVDTQEQRDGPEDLDDLIADEYRYVSEVEKGTCQALGSTTGDQTKDDLEGKNLDKDEDDVVVRDKEDVDRMDYVKEGSEISNLTTSHSMVSRHKPDDEMLDSVVANDDLMEEQHQNSKGFSGDLVSFKSSYMNERVIPLDTLERGPYLDSMEIDLPYDVKQKALSDWRRYELATGKLSQELAEQLRLVMEPTLASKLQGDYRTGKRINMKKVIPYIASHYRKDKIWLRRTRPNKRDYQVVVAIDDSRSMSESQCGNAAVESLVTVCRAMSQLEVGQFAVASFGEKGNIKLLHDFDQPFTGDAGVKIISSLSFKQDNTIADEPVVDLLKYLNNMLDTAVAKARTPSGQNPLHQLILIIADGMLHEKENLKRCVRNVLNMKRMVAFIVLDSPKESIVDLMEASSEEGKLEITRYLNSFPFPYYIILKNKETLPRALADLLRQWFELMNSMHE